MIFYKLYNYYEHLKDYTPETWDDYTFSQANEGKFIIKGRTNSRKYEWNKLMFASNKKQAMVIAGELMKDGLIGPQGVIYRKYIPLKTFEIGLNDLPFTNEFRFFFYKEHLLSHGYYWSSAEENVIANASISSDGIDFARKIAKIASEHVNFFVLDIAEKEEGGWILIEVNDGQQSGLSENDPHVLYQNLIKFL